ncbi:hypothetical protein Zmor_017322 [Zophobas morio]|uniref:Uncharacterized protein n=1 Tax=Zophobas morio TaxID=2755281 RepID=A0AA38I8N1_9CUCU|nr:hypothetical protein Zmor_017322 [Zophobas morio]
MAAGALVFLSLLPCVFMDTKFTSGNCSYHWTLYNGTIPEDAIPGGRDVSGETFYVGLVQLKLINEVFAGMILPSSGTARITSLGITREVKNDPFTIINILCSSDKEAFEWVSTKSENLHLLTDHNLVGGGKVLGQDLYIGRVRSDGGIVLGKVFPHRFIYQGLYVPSKGVFAQFMSYQVLAFNCKDKKRDKEEDFDFGGRNGENGTLEF